MQSQTLQLAIIKTDSFVADSRKSSENIGPPSSTFLNFLTKSIHHYARQVKEFVQNYPAESLLGAVILVGAGLTGIGLVAEAVALITMGITIYVVGTGLALMVLIAHFTDDSIQESNHIADFGVKSEKLTQEFVDMDNIDTQTENLAYDNYCDVIFDREATGERIS